MTELDRYSIVSTHMKRELILLQGQGCVWKKCKFCDYYNDTSDNPFRINKPIIDKITGIYGVVDAINSGSIFELDSESMNYLRDKLREKNVHTMWCESHWLYHKRLGEIRKFFDGINVKFRVGAETFNAEMLKKWNKGIPQHIAAETMAKYFDGVCPLVCVQGQTKEMIIKDIELAMKNFSYFNVNVFVENRTEVKPDKELVKWFTDEIAPKLEKYENIEVLLNNTDLGVG